MYWQVYLHKTVVSAEKMMIHAIKRAKELMGNGTAVFATPALEFFLKNTVNKEQLTNNPEVLYYFAQLDDMDIFSSLKVWTSHTDKVLSKLASGIIHRKLSKVEIAKEAFLESRIDAQRKKVIDDFACTNHEASFFVYADVLTNNAYNSEKENINLLMKSGEIVDISIASDNLNISALAQPVNKYAFFYPRTVFNKG
jgi:HD superfamily phosphohydrolase